MSHTDAMSLVLERARLVLEGERVRLRELREADLPQLVAWWRDPDVAIFNDRIQPRPDGPLEEMFKAWSSNDSSAGAAFCVEAVEGDLVGHVSLMSSRLTQARERERVAVMRDVATIAVRLFGDRGYDNVTMEDVAEATGVSVATLYRRFTTKENLVCWHPDEQVGIATLVEAIRAGHDISRAAMDLAQLLPDEAIEATARTRLQLIADHASLRAVAREKAESFVTATLEASGAHDQRPLLERETHARCVAAAFEAGNNAWLRGEGSLRSCAIRALALLERTGTQRSS